MKTSFTKSKITAGMFTSRTDEWATPAHLFESLKGEFNFDLDVAANARNAKCKNYFSKRQNGLSQNWCKQSKTKFVFCNPPYGASIGKWVQKSFNESQKGCTVVLLIPFRPDTSYLHEYVFNKAYEIRLIRGRLKYNDGEQNAPFPTAIIIFRPGKFKTRWVTVDKEGEELTEALKTIRTIGMKKGHTLGELVLAHEPKADLNIPEIKVSYERDNRHQFTQLITTTEDVANFIRSIFGYGEIELQEHFIVVFLTASNQIIGYYKHSKGGVTSVPVDIRLIIGVALKCVAVKMIISHNHPSGSLVPSDADKETTKKITKAAALFDIYVLDHLIVTATDYYSFVSDNLMGFDDDVLKKPQLSFLKAVESQLKSGSQQNKKNVEAIAAKFDISDKTEIKELTELAIVNTARNIAAEQDTVKNKFDKIVLLYKKQVILSHRTSQSILLQQYSTPAPIGYLMGVFCGLPDLDTGEFAFEPSAGNGLLTIATNPKRVYVNEVDYLRNRNLKTQGYKEVLALDASKETSFSSLPKFKAVLTNPPFGRLPKAAYYESFPITDLDHLMSLRALDKMAYNGRAAIIIGGHTRWDEEGRIQAGKNRIYFNYLYKHYHVADVIQIDGHKLYSRQGTAFPVRLILISGRKKIPEGFAPVKNNVLDVVIDTFEDLYDRVIHISDDAPVNIPNEKNMQVDLKTLEREALDLEKLFSDDEELGAPYLPSSHSLSLDTQVPDSMSFETQSALERIRNEVGGSMDNFVRHRLGYASETALYKALSAEQIDAVAMAIYNIEAREQGMIIGDQTGIGKGRIAAAMIRYGVKRGLKPIFVTEKASLFSSLYRDISAIGSAHLKPFIINGREAKSDIKDEDGHVVYQALSPSEQQTIFDSNEAPAGYDFVVGTYSQFNSPEKKPTKPNYLREIAKGNLLIMDESHNSSGSSNTGAFMQGIVAETLGVVFLSATFAKRPDNMPIYAMKTAISEANLSKDDLVEAIQKGGVALQEILASQLVAEGQMIRRERSFEGVEVNYLSMDALEEQHRRTADNITFILRDIIAFQDRFITPTVKKMDKIAVAEGKEVKLRGGTSQAGVDSTPYFSKVFNVINQMLFSIKAEAVADRAIQRLKEGKKPVIAFASTMESFIEQMETDKGMAVTEGDLINNDFSEVLRRGLKGVMRYTVYGHDGLPEYKTIDLLELSEDANFEYQRILSEISTASTGIGISPIDLIIHKIEDAGYSVAEVTGRKYCIQSNNSGTKGLIASRKKIAANDAFRMFNNNETDVLMINQSGSTGESAHAIITPKVPASEVKQRVMIVLQAELDINIEVQKRGRINRTGQILKPIYDYMISAIPAEKRLMMMLQKKLKSLDANTTSNQKQSNKILDVPDFLNKYGNKIVKEYLIENKDINELLGDPLGLTKDDGEGEQSEEDLENAAHKVSGRVAVLSTKMQADFYSEITERYNDYVEYLKQTGEYDLEVEALDLKAETVETSVQIIGKGGESAFGEDSILEKINANILKKPFKGDELVKLLDEALDGKSAEENKKELLSDFSKEWETRREAELDRITKKYENMVNDLENDKKLQKILEKQGQAAYKQELTSRKNELNEAKDLSLQDILNSYENKKANLTRLFDFYTIGRKLAYPVVSFDNGTESILAVCLGIVVDKKKKNPYAPGVIKVRIAIANGKKYIAMPASNTDMISKIISASYDIENTDREDLLSDWETEIKNKTKDRGIRYMITGNLLQAFSGDSGKLVSYTTINGETHKGILMPEEWRPKSKGEQLIQVPIAKALPILQSMPNGTQLSASHELTFFKVRETYKIILPAARSRGGEIYMDQSIWPLIQNNRFETISGQMQAILPERNIEALAKILQSKHSVSVELGHHQLSQIKSSSLRLLSRKSIELPSQEDENETERIRILELEAEALELELDLAA